MKKSKWFTGPAVLGLTLVMSGMALHAQPGTAPGGNNPQGGGGGGNRPNFREMTPEQRQQFMRQMQEQRIRGMLAPAGFTDAALQDAVIAFVNEQDKATEELQQKQRQIARAAREGGMADAQLATLLADFRAAVAAEKTRRATATTALDAKIEFSKKPRLDALLTTAGIIGDESSIVDSMAGRGMGGFGGGFGGGRGGRGGRGQGGGQGGRA